MTACTGVLRWNDRAVMRSSAFLTCRRCLLSCLARFQRLIWTDTDRNKLYYFTGSLADKNPPPLGCKTGLTLRG